MSCDSFRSYPLDFTRQRLVDCLDNTAFQDTDDSWVVDLQLCIHVLT